MAHRDLAWADTTISSSTGVQSWTSGNFTITNTGTISGGSRPLTSSGTLGTLTNSGTISGTRTGIFNTGTISAVTNSGIIAATLGGVSNFTGGSIATFVNTGTISGGNTGFGNRSSIGTLFNSGTIIGNGNYFGLANSGTIGTLGNSGTIRSNNGDGLTNSGSIGTLGNSSSIISSNGSGLSNSGSIGTLGNSGSISGLNGINNSGTIATLTNSGSLSAHNSGVGIWNAGGSIGTLTNSGTISGGVTTGLGNSGGSIGTLTNSGVITDVKWGLSNFAAATIGVLDNSAGGTIHGDHTGLNNAANIGVLTNSGTISGGSKGLLNTGSIGTLTNSGVIAGPANAIAITGGSIGPITNSGVIAGDILNSTSNALTIAGGTGSTFGLLTGYNSGTPSLASPGAVGSITSTSADLVLSTGNLLLNDNINVGATHTVRNTGATLQIQNPITITGAYSQSGGGLVVVTTSGGSYGYLTVSGNATVSNATITISGSGLHAGETFSVVRSGGTGSYIDDTAAVSGTRALIATVTASGNDLLVTLVGDGTHYTQLGQTAGGVAVGMGTALDAVNQSSSAAATAFQNTVLKSLDALPAANQPVAVKQLAPTQLSPFLQVATQAVAPVVAAIEQHQLAMLRDGGVGAAAGSGGHDDALWGQALGGQALRDSTAGADGYRANYGGLALGFDHQATPALVVGVALSWLRGRSLGLDGSAGSNVTTDNYQLTAYGLQRFGRAFIDGEAGLGYTGFNQNRAIGFLGANAHANYGGMLYLARLGAGYDMPIGGNVTFTPLGGLRFLSVVSGAYTESGAGNADLSVDRHSAQALTQDLGGKVAWQMNTRWGAFRPEVRLAWVHDYTQGPIAASGLIGGEAFISPVTRLSADGARMNLAATLERSDELTLRVEYEGEIRANYHSQTGVIRVNWAF